MEIKVSYLFPIFYTRNLIGLVINQKFESFKRVIIADYCSIIHTYF